MKLLIILSGLLFSYQPAASAQRLSELQAPINPSAAIHRLQPDLSRQDAARLEHALIKVSQSDACDIAWPLLLSIAYHESSLRKAAVNRISKDYGLMQINQRMVSRLKLDRKRLLTDEEYSLRAACHILTANKRQFADKISYWLGIYRAGTGIWLERVRANALAYDTIIRRKAQELMRLRLEYAETQ